MKTKPDYVLRVLVTLLICSTLIAVGVVIGMQL